MRRSACEARSWPRVWSVSLGAVVVALLAFAALGLVAPVAHAQSSLVLDTCPQQPVAGRHIYDCASALTASEIGDLEKQALAVQQAGASIVVYLQIKSASYDQALSDAADLMNRWDVESAPGAKDGVVFMFDLTPGDIQHGEVALYAGQKQLDGPMPQNELNNIYQNDMLPDLKAGDMAAGISAGLDAIASDVTTGAGGDNSNYGASSSDGSGATPANLGAQVIGGWPFNILAVLLAVAVLWIGFADERRANEATSGLTTTPTTTPPADLKPALAGALITGQVGDAQMEATIVDFAQRGMLHIDSAESDKASLLLLGNGQGLTGYEKKLWLALDQLAKSDNDNENNRVISHEHMYELAQNWWPAIGALRDELYQRGWYDADRGEKQGPLVGLALLGFLLALAGFFLGLMAQQPWPFLGMLICFVMGIAALAFVHSIPLVTPEGLRAAQPARDYIAGMDRINAPETRTEEVESNAALPYFVAANRGYSFTTLHLAEDAPHVAAPVAAPVALYSSWLWLHNSMTPPPPPPGSYSGGHYYGGGFSGGFGGGAAGGGGAGGHF